MFVCVGIVAVVHYPFGYFTISLPFANFFFQLRTSTFRERQSTVFLRQFRKFYRRLLKHKAALGSGEVSDIVEKLPGVPDLKDLIDVDTLLYEAGLIEETEKDDDNSVATFRPSQQSLSMSFKAARKLAKKSNSLQRNKSDKILPVTITEEDFDADVNVSGFIFLTLFLNFVLLIPKKNHADCLFV